MASNNTPLSAIVASLLSAFDSSRQLFHRINSSAQKKHEKSKLSKRHPDQGLTDDDAVAQEEQILQLQLRRAPKQIMEAFEGNAGRFGERYRRGDERAKTSLNHTLLVLNTGLTKIISSLLGRNNNAMLIRNEARKSLLSLSETSTRDALMELEGLRMRLESMSSLQLRDASLVARQQHQQRRRRNHKRLEESKEVVAGHLQRESHHAKTTSAHQSENGKQNDKKKSSSVASSGMISNQRGVGKTATATATAVPQQQSMSTNKTRKDKGQLQDNHPVWVRSKNSSTIALDTRPTYKRASSSGDNTVTKASSKPHHSTAASSPNLVLPTKPVAPRNLPGQPPSRPHHHADTIQPPPSLIAAPRLGNTYPPQITQKQQHDATIDINKRLSILSGSSGSTKLGEIPQHKWINPWIPPVEVDDDDDRDEDYEDDHARGDMQNVDKQRDGGSKRGGLRFWRRLGRNHKDPV